MRTLADLIEAFLLERLEAAESVEVRRAELSERFGCAPSQVNYVLETRFRPELGFLVESRRGGGGYIRIRRLPEAGPRRRLLAEAAAVGERISQDQALRLIGRLREQGLLAEREALLLSVAVDRSVLAVELPWRDRIRARLLAAMLGVLGRVAGGEAEL
ncbi:MAG: CtsR family transcriptional regulator [Clostridia bacterium]|nr:CtsR family transcriptional regulator [Clostridia bacterium]MCL6521287.1 CtsR family transcriptional regulator [Bacillota bacterium]